MEAFSGTTILGNFLTVVENQPFVNPLSAYTSLSSFTTLSGQVQVLSAQTTANTINISTISGNLNTLSSQVQTLSSITTGNTNNIITLSGIVTGLTGQVQLLSAQTTANTINIGVLSANQITISGNLSTLSGQVRILSALSINSGTSFGNTLYNSGGTWLENSNVKSSTTGFSYSFGNTFLTANSSGLTIGRNYVESVYIGATDPSDVFRRIVITGGTGISVSGRSGETVYVRNDSVSAITLTGGSGIQINSGSTFGLNPTEAVELTYVGGQWRIMSTNFSRPYFIPTLSATPVRLDFLGDRFFQVSANTTRTGILPPNAAIGTTYTFKKIPGSGASTFIISAFTGEQIEGGTSYTLAGGAGSAISAIKTSGQWLVY